MLIENARIVTPTGVIARGWLLCREGLIAAMGEGSAAPHLAPPAERLNAKGELLLPGFVDIHVHGSDGADTMDATPDALHRMARFYARHGVTGFLATTWTDTRPRISAALASVRALMYTPIDGGAGLLGVHLEGPYLNPEKCGAQNRDLIRQADPREAEAWLDLDIIRLVSLAPEFEANHWLIDACLQRGITVSIAHTSATYEQTLAAIQRGITHTTHTFNAMPPLLHREPGVLGAVLNDSRVRCELIADLVHVHPAMMRLLWQIKRPHGLILITDAMRAAGQPDGDYPVDERVIHVRDGIARLPGGIAGGQHADDGSGRASLHADGGRAAGDAVARHELQCGACDSCGASQGQPGDWQGCRPRASERADGDGSRDDGWGAAGVFVAAGIII